MNKTIRLAKQLARELNLFADLFEAYKPTVSEAASMVLVHAELVATDGYQPSQYALNRLRNSVRVYQESLRVDAGEAKNDQQS